MSVNNSPTDAPPLYQQIRNAILDEIASGEVADGTKLTERELQERFGVSRSTVRHALEALEWQGIVTRRQGVGTMVTAPTIQPQIMHLTSFTEDVRRRGLMPSSKTLDLKLVVPPSSVSRALGLEEGVKVWYVLRLRIIDGQPVGLHDLYIPPTLEFAPQALSTMSSYYELLRVQHGREPVRAVETLTAKNADERESSLLNVAAGTALLAIERLTHDQYGEPVEYVCVAYCADYYEYQIMLSRQSDGSENYE